VKVKLTPNKWKLLQEAAEQKGLTPETLGSQIIEVYLIEFKDRMET
jgi:hypothetical protein